MRRVIKIFIFIYILTTSLSFGDDPIKLTLDEAIEIALRDNRDILLKKEEVKRAKEKLKEVRAQILPELSFRSSVLEILDYYEKDVSTSSNQISVKQPLYTGGKISGNIQKNKYGIEIGKALLDKTVLEIIFNVKKTFYTLILAKEYAKINGLIINNTKNHLKVLTERYHYGQASESELIRLRQALTTVEYVLNYSLNQIKEMETVLKNTLYLEKDIEIEPIGEFVYEPIEVAFNEIYLKALKERPELHLYEMQEKINNLQKEIVKAELLPNVYASWDYYLNRSNSPGVVSQGWENHQVMGVVISWPIFDGFATQAKIRQAELDLKETKLLKEKIVTDIILELKNAYLELNDAISKLKAKDAEIKFYEDNLRVIRDKYNKGIVSNLDLEDAELSLEIAKFNRKEAIYDYLIAKAKLEKAIGEMR